MPNTVINLENVSVFHNKNLVLSNVSLHLDKGEFVYVIGKTGTGKSSLLRLLYGDLQLKQGEGTVAGFNLKLLRTKQIPFLRRKIGIVFQDFQLLTDRNVRENLLFVLKSTGWHEKDKIENRIREVLDQVGLGTKGFKLPHELSGGEQQRLVIARALLNNPELIIADEPTGNLDPETSTEIMNLLLDIARKGSSVMMATHNYMLIEKFPSRVIKVEAGKVVEQSV